jgi:hypothetical protein
MDENPDALPTPNLGKVYLLQRQVSRDLGNFLFWASLLVYLMSIVGTGFCLFLILSEPVWGLDVFLMLFSLWGAAVIGIGLSILLTAFSISHGRGGTILLLIEAITVLVLMTFGGLVSIG